LELMDSYWAKEPFCYSAKFGRKIKVERLCDDGDGRIKVPGMYQLNSHQHSSQLIFTSTPIYLFATQSTFHQHASYAELCKLLQDLSVITTQLHRFHPNSFQPPSVFGSIVDHLNSSFGHDPILYECSHHSSEPCLTVLNIDSLS
jgi:hypothetical protein